MVDRSLFSGYAVEEGDHQVCDHLLSRISFAPGCFHTFGNLWLSLCFFRGSRPRMVMRSRRRPKIAGFLLLRRSEGTGKMLFLDNFVSGELAFFYGSGVYLDSGNTRCPFQGFAPF
jgi:hypothetical protein